MYCISLVLFQKLNKQMRAQFYFHSFAFSLLFLVSCFQLVISFQYCFQFLVSDKQNSLFPFEFSFGQLRIGLSRIVCFHFNVALFIYFLLLIYLYRIVCFHLNSVLFIYFSVMNLFKVVSSLFKLNSSLLISLQSNVFRFCLRISLKLICWLNRFVY